MGGEDRDSLAGSVETRDHPFVERLQTGWSPSLGFTLPHVIQRRFKAMVTVGDKQFLGSHRFLDRLNRTPVGHRPYPVQSAEIVLYFDFGRTAGGLHIEDPVHGQPVVVVKHENQVVIALRAAHELQAIHLGAGQSALVRQNSGCGTLQIQERDESLSHLCLAVGLVILIIDINGGLRILNQKPLLYPAPQRRRSCRILCVGILVLLQAPGNLNHAVGRAPVVLLLHFRRDLVVWLGHDPAEIGNDLSIVSVRLKRKQMSHCLWIVPQ